MLDLGILGVTPRQTIRSYQSKSIRVYNLSTSAVENNRKHDDLCV